jgi:hypothetical protein
MPAAGAQGSAAALGWQHLTDQLFQVLTRNGSALVGSRQDTLECGLTGQLLPPSRPEGLDWDAAGSALEWRGQADLSLTPPARQDRAGQAAAPTVTDRAALDQAFAQAADDTDWTDDEE